MVPATAKGRLRRKAIVFDEIRVLGRALVGAWSLEEALVKMEMEMGLEV